MATYLVWKDNVISMVRGDTLKIKLTIVKDEQQGLVGYINKNIEASKIYQLKEGDKVYFGLMAPNHTFEQSTIIKYIEQGEEPVREPIIPQGTLDITENGEVDVYEYASVNINVPQPEGTCEITENGEYEVFDGTSGYSIVNVNVTPPPAIPLYTVNINNLSDEYSFVRINQPGEYISGLISSPDPLPNANINYVTDLYINPFSTNEELSCRLIPGHYLVFESGNIIDSVTGDAEKITDTTATISGNCTINLISVNPGGR